MALLTMFADLATHLTWNIPMSRRSAVTTLAANPNQRATLPQRFTGIRHRQTQQRLLTTANKRRHATAKGTWLQPTWRSRNALLLAAFCRHQQVMVQYAVQRRAANAGVVAVLKDLAAQIIAAQSK